MMRFTTGFIFIIFTFHLIEALKDTEGDHRETFNLFDVDRDGYITEGDVDRFLASALSNFVIDKVKFKEAIIHAINTYGDTQGLNFNAYLKYMKQKDEEYPDAKLQSVKLMFNNKPKVSKDELCKKFGLDKAGLDKPMYTIQEYTRQS